MFVTITTAREHVGTLIEQEITLDDLVEACTTFEVGEKNGDALIFGRFKRCPESGCVGTGTYDCGGGKDHRLSRNVTELHGLGTDLDDITEETVNRITETLAARGVWFVVWTTHSHAPPEKCRIRILFPFASPMPLSSPRQWSAVAWPALIRHLGLPVGTDFSCRNGDRVYYLPRVPSEESPRAAGVHRGELLDWRTVPGLQDALSAMSAETASIEAAPDEDPTRPVDVGAIRATLEKISTSDYLKRALKGEAPTPPPDRRPLGMHPRREAWREITALVANAVEGWEDSNVLLNEFVRPAWRKEVDASPDDHTAWEKIEELFRDARASAPTYKAEKKARERGWYEVRRAQFRRLAADGGTSETAAAHPIQSESVTAPAARASTQRELTDLGNAERFADQHAHVIRYASDQGVWYAWDGRRWAREDATKALQLAAKTARSIYGEADRCLDKDKGTVIGKHAIASESRSRQEAMVALAKARAEIRIKGAGLDADLMLFNCSNGTIDLRTGVLRPHAQSDLITKISPVIYDPAALCPVWERTLADVLPDEAVRLFVQRAIGYALTADVSEQVLFFFCGDGSNGKSTMLTTLQLHVFGEYARQGSPDLLLSSHHEAHPTNQADLAGARLVVCAEVEKGKAFAEVQIKQLTGGDVIKARFMRQDFFEFSPTHKIFLAANHKPRVRGTDHGIWRRLRLIPFNVKIDDAKKDTQLRAKLQAEAPGILAWAVRGCLEWQRSGLGTVPETIRRATEEYRGAEDTVGTFCSEHLIGDVNAWTATDEIYRAYVRWCEQAGEKPLTKRDLGAELGRKGYESRQGRVPGKPHQVSGWRVSLPKASIAAQVAQAPADDAGPAAGKELLQ